MPDGLHALRDIHEGADAKILDAALDLFAEIGIRRAGTDDIARRAGVNRATLYRRLGTKDEIVRAAMLRETARLIDEIAGRLEPVTDPVERIGLGFAITVLALRTNRILAKALAVDPVETLPTITVDAAEVVTLATTFVAEQIVMASQGAAGDEPELAAMIVRLIHSLILTPDAPPLLRTESELREFALRRIVPLVLRT